MKHSGKAYLKVVGVNRLPTVYELTGDPEWVVVNNHPFQMVESVFSFSGSIPRT